VPADRALPPAKACPQCKSLKTRRTGAFSMEPASAVRTSGNPGRDANLVTYDRRCEECGAIFAEREVRYV
jgi:predicted Zn-ribbon and HTH transcriptional regulator